jgi:hypothetical protein
MPLLAPQFESVVTAELSDADGDDLRSGGLAQYLDALNRPHDQAARDEAFTRQWSERELSVVYGVAAALLGVELRTVCVEAGVDRALGTRHFRSSSECLVVHDLYDRMFVELVRVMAQTVIESDDRAVAGDAGDMESAISTAVVAASFAHDSLPNYTHAQLLANLKMVSFQSGATRGRIAMQRRNGQGILPSVQMAAVSDLVMGLHELSHLHVRRPPDSGSLVSMLASFSVDILKSAVRVLESSSAVVPGIEDVVSFLTSEKTLKDDKVVAIIVESEVDRLALDCFERTGLYSRIDARTTACVMFGVTLLQFCRKLGSLLAGRSDPHEAIVQAKAVAVLRLSSAVMTILTGQGSADDILEQEHTFMRALFVHLLEATGWLESLFLDGLRGIVFNSFAAHMNRWFDKYPVSEDLRDQHDGTVPLAEIEKWAANILLHNWIDYSKPNRGTLRMDAIFGNRLGPRNQDTYLYLKDELAET